MSGLQINNVSKSFGDTKVLQNINVDIKPGEFFTLVGESGCGKSTLLRIISGLESPDTGSIHINNNNVSNMDPKNRNVAMVFQDYALYPHMKVRQNLEMPLLMTKTSFAQRIPLINRFRFNSFEKSEIKKNVEDTAKKLRIEHLLDRKPGQLSGGQRQRVALGRSLVRNPEIFLMDEPLSNLDAKLRESVRTEITQLHKDTGLTFVYVTHDQTEAMTMSSKIGLMHLGKFIQIGTPRELYKNPSNLTVARFIGSPEINIVPLRAFTKISEKVSGTVKGEYSSADIEDFVFGIRPEDFVILSEQSHEKYGNKNEEDLEASFDVKIVNVEDLGHEMFVHCSGFSASTAVRIRATKRSFLSNRGSGNTIKLKVSLREATLFDQKGERVEGFTSVQDN